MPKQKQGGTLFCITKGQKIHIKENIKPHFIRGILIQMMRSLVLSLFSIKNSGSFVPLNFINEAIIRGWRGDGRRRRPRSPLARAVQYCPSEQSPMPQPALPVRLLINRFLAGHLRCMNCSAF